METKGTLKVSVVFVKLLFPKKSRAKVSLPNVLIGYRIG